MSTVAIYADAVSTTANEVLRYGVIGTGMMGVEHIRNLLQLPKAEIVAICDSNEESLRRAAALFPNSNVQQFTDYHDVLDAKEIDVLVIATPNHSHVDIILDALETTCHILIEKPLCTSVIDCLRVIEKEAKVGLADRVVWVGLEYRYMPVTEQLLQRVAANEVGDVKMISIREHRFPFLKKVEDWNRFNKNTGGTLVEKCCHFFDLMNLAIGARPLRVYASGGQDVNHLDEIYENERADILDNAFVIVDYANGVRASLDLCMFAEAGRNEQEIVAVGSLGKAETSLPGEGQVYVGHRSDRVVTPHLATMDASVAHAGFHFGASFIEVAKFCEAVRDGRPPEVGVRDGLWSVVIGAAAHRSIDEQRSVLISEYNLDRND